jgi:predicted DNA-binding transcriptional regulator AlpA
MIRASLAYTEREMQSKKYLKMNEVAALIGLHRSSIYRLMNEDATFPRPFRIGKSPRFRIDMIEEWITSRHDA